jgi:hypothetical protein
MDRDKFPRWGARVPDWAADFRRTLRDRQVRAHTQPGEIAAALSADADQIALVNRINDDGRIHLAQTSVKDRTVIRFQVGAFATTAADIDVDVAFETITELVAEDPVP